MKSLILVTAVLGLSHPTLAANQTQGSSSQSSQPSNPTTGGARVVTPGVANPNPDISNQDPSSPQAPGSFRPNPLPGSGTNTNPMNTRTSNSGVPGQTTEQDAQNRLQRQNDPNNNNLNNPNRIPGQPVSPTPQGSGTRF